MFADLQTWWLHRMAQTPRPLEENLTLLWHDHFASRYRDVRDAFLMYQQNALFRAHANDSFVALAEGIVRDPAMIRFLNNDRNRRQHPNENLARELMELFTLGEGHYTEHDIKEAARALTGYQVDDDDFLFRRGAHDPGHKTILGREDDFDGDMLVRHLLRQRECLVFVAFKLYNRYVADVGGALADVPNANQSPILEIASLLRQHEYSFKPVLRTIFKSEHFYDAQVVGRKIKSPAQLVVGTERMMATPTRNYDVVRREMRLMGQDLFNPPSVAGWDRGRAWINTSTLFARQNACAYLITGEQRYRRHGRPDGGEYDPMTLLKDAADRTPKAVVDLLVNILLGDHIPDQRRAPLVKFMQQRGETVTRDDLVPLLLLVSAMPEYQLC